MGLANEKEEGERRAEMRKGKVSKRKYDTEN